MSNTTKNTQTRQITHQPTRKEPSLSVEAKNIYDKKSFASKMKIQGMIAGTAFIASGSTNFMKEAPAFSDDMLLDSAPTTEIAEPLTIIDSDQNIIEEPSEIINDIHSDQNIIEESTKITNDIDWDQNIIEEPREIMNDLAGETVNELNELDENETTNLAEYENESPESEPVLAPPTRTINKVAVAELGAGAGLVLAGLSTTMTKPKKQEHKLGKNIGNANQKVETSGQSAAPIPKVIQQYNNTNWRIVKRDIIDNTTANLIPMGAGLIYVGLQPVVLDILGPMPLVMGTGTLLGGFGSLIYQHKRALLPGPDYLSDHLLLADWNEMLHYPKQPITQKEEKEILAYIEKIEQELNDQKKGNIPTEQEKIAAEKSLMTTLEALWNHLKNKDWKQAASNISFTFGRGATRSAILLVTISFLLLKLGYAIFIPVVLGAAAGCLAGGAALSAIGSLIKHFNNANQENHIHITEKDFEDFLEKKRH